MLIPASIVIVLYTHKMSKLFTVYNIGYAK